MAATLGAFAAVVKGGRVVTWGRDVFGGDSSDVAEELESGVVNVESMNNIRFVAWKDDGSVVEWGEDLRDDPYTYM